MTGHAASCVDKYLEFGNLESSSLKYVAHPCIDDRMLNDDDLNTKGTLSPVAARIVLKILYLSRHNRPDTLWTVNALSRNVTEWTKGDDKRLHRLISYIHYHPTCIQFCYVGDHLRDCYLALFCDAGFAGDLSDSKSTGGYFLYLVGPRTRVPISWACKKHGAVSHSSTEAEIISLDAGMRMVGLPVLLLWEDILCTMYGIKRSALGIDRIFNSSGMYSILSNVDYVSPTLPPHQGNAKLICLEDNGAVIKMLIKGRTNKLRHVPRTHRIDLDWLFEVLREDPGVNIKYINTKEQVAEIFTKDIFTIPQWRHLAFLRNIGDSSLSVVIFKINQRKAFTTMHSPLLSAI